MSNNIEWEDVRRIIHYYGRRSRHWLEEGDVFEADMLIDEAEQVYRRWKGQ